MSSKYARVFVRDFGGCVGAQSYCRCCEIKDPQKERGMQVPKGFDRVESFSIPSKGN